MSKSRKEEIKELVDELTFTYLKNADYTFDLCNAHDIALTLKLDRSNVSRLLNGMFKDFELIKIKGRPTFYISRHVLENDFKYASIPQIIDSREDLEVLFRQSTVNKVINVKTNFDIVGNRPGDSLYSIVNLIVPGVAFKHTYTTLIVLNGNRGSGRRHFSAKMHRFAKKNKKIPSSSMIYQTTAHNLIKKGFSSTEIENIGMIIIDVKEDFVKEEISVVIDDISSQYMNRNIPCPVIVLITTLSKETEKRFYSALTPYYVDFPRFEQRPSKEIVHIIVNEFQKASNEMSVRLRVMNEVILRLATTKYQFGFNQMINEISALLARVAFMSRNINSNTLFISNDFLRSDVFNNTREDRHFIEQTNQIVLSMFPEIIDFNPNAEAEVIKILDSINNQEEIFKDVPKRNIILQAKYDVLTSSTDLSYKFSKDNERLVFLLNHLFDNSFLKNDTAVLDRLYSTLNQMIEGTYIAKFSNEDIAVKENKFSRITSDIIIDVIQNKFEVTISDIYRKYIKNYLFYASKLTASNNITLLVLNDQSGIGSNYAYALNQRMDSRVSFSLNYNDSLRPLTGFELDKKLSLGVTKINRGKGVVIFSDKKLPNRQEESIFVSTGIPTISLYDSSALLLSEIGRQIDNPSINLTSLLYNIVRTKGEIQSYLKDDSPQGIFLENIKELYGEIGYQIFHHINLSSVGNLLLDLSQEIVYTLEMPMTNAIQMELIFGILLMLDRYKSKIPLVFHNLEEFKDKHYKEYNAVRNVLQKQKQLLVISFSEDEIATLTSIVLDHKSNNDEINIVS